MRASTGHAGFALARNSAIWSELAYQASLALETAALATLCGVSLPDDQAALLHARTDGWVAGIRLATLALRGHPEPTEFLAAFKVLIEAGANPNAKSPDGQTLLHQVARAGNLELIKVLFALE